MAAITGAGLCRNWATSGTCHFGQTCRYAHLDQAGQPTHTPPAQSTTPCRNFQTTGVCRFGDSCNFSHDVAAPAAAPPARPAKPPSNEPAQEYDTYLDKETGHHRLKGGAMMIRDPTAEELAAAEAQGGRGAPPPAN